MTSCIVAFVVVGGSKELRVARDELDWEYENVFVGADGIRGVGCTEFWSGTFLCKSMPQAEGKTASTSKGRCIIWLVLASRKI